VNAHSERLCGLDSRDHVLVAGHQDRVGDRPMPGKCFHIRTDLGVDALLLTARVQVAQPQLDPRHLSDHALVDGRHPVARGVVPVDPQQLASDLVFRMPGQCLDQLVRVDPVLAAGRGAEEQLACGRVDIADVDHDRVAGEQR
jgi:hypothetical protein